MEQLKVRLIVVFVVIAVIYLLIYVAMGLSAIRKRKKLGRYWKVEIGMPENEMLDIMGDGYNRSLLQNNRVKYEWRIQASSSGYTYYNGARTNSYTGDRKVEIYVKDGCVEEIISNNV